MTRQNAKKAARVARTTIVMYAFTIWFGVICVLSSGYRSRPLVRLPNEEITGTHPRFLYEPLFFGCKARRSDSLAVADTLSPEARTSAREKYGNDRIEK